MKCVLKKTEICPDYSSRQFNLRVAYLQNWDEFKNNCQKQAAWLAYDESNEFSSDTETRACNAILGTIY